MPLKLGTQDVTLKLGTQDVTAYLGADIVSLHPEAVAWRDAVVDNGGSVSGATLAAVSDFCTAIDAAGIRDRFYRLNLFAGTGINAALVPLYRGPSRTGTQYGNATDTNNGPFVSGDYAETGASGGLKGNGTSKYLDTGLPMNYPATNGDRHLGIYKTLLATQTAASIAAVDSASPLTLYQLLRLSTQIQYFSGGNTTNAVQTDAVGHWLAMGTVNKSLYLNGVEQVSNSTGSDTVNTATRSFYVFARNDSGTTNIYSNERQAAYSIGSSMNATQAAGFYTAMQAFQTALGRNV
jgi:hypothetical protein